MREAIFKDKLEVVGKIDKVKEKIKQMEKALYALKADEKKIDTEIHLELRKNNLSRYEYDNHEFSYKTEVLTAILDSNRKDAVKYDNKFHLGLFRLSLDGMRLKAWVRSLLDKQLTVPSFISFQDYKRVQVKRLER